MDNHDDENYQRAKRRLEDVKEFYIDLVIYVAVNIVLIIINLVFTPGYWWFAFPLVIWGLFILYDFLQTFVFENKIFSKKWEEKKIKEYMNDKK
ncbi:MAG: 2TM domain-containing protein [Methanobrevibacter sp.]|nr:2TM domain-containing protein [Methanobrevibacter sp.]